MRGAATSLTGPKGDIHWHALVFVWLADDRRFIGDVLFVLVVLAVFIRIAGRHHAANDREGTPVHPRGSFRGDVWGHVVASGM